MCRIRNNGGADGPFFEMALEHSDMGSREQQEPWGVAKEKEKLAKTWRRSLLY